MGESHKPYWLTTSFLNVVLQSMENTKEPIKITAFQSEAAVPPGTNYLSLLYRVTAEFTVGDDNKMRSRKIIVKTPLEKKGAFKEAMDKGGAYQQEINVYKSIMPRLNEISTCNVSPTSFDCPLDDVLVLEDLKEKGYKMADRIKQLDLNHCKLALSTLAKFHAHSFVLHKTEPRLVNVKGTNTEEKPDKDEKGFFKLGFEAMLKTLETISGCEKYLEMIKERKLSLLNQDILRSEPNPNSFNVLCHGDIWTTNVLFQYDSSGQPINAKLIDFQLSKYHSFAKDILHFWITSANKEVRDHYRCEVFECYRLSLNNTLEELQCPERLSKELFDQEIKRFATLTIALACGGLIFFMGDPEEPLDIECFFNNDEKKVFNETSPLMKAFQGKYYKALLPDVLRQAEQLGAFS